MATQQNIARDDAITAIRFPIRLLTIALLLTTVAFAWFGWVIFDSSRDAKMFQDESLRIEELRGVIVHLDEVLTMSARMAAATGDPKWEERYRRFEPQLDAAIKETTKLGTTLHDIKPATVTDAANIKLVEMENRAFALARAGRKEEAQTVLFSPEYEVQKKIYAEGIKSFNSQIRREVDDHNRQDRRIDFGLMIGALVVLAMSFAAWLSVVLRLQRWRTDLKQAVSERQQAEQSLQRAHDELEVRIEQRTAELGKTNQALEAEITERKRNEEQLRVQATALDAAAHAIVITDHNGTIQSVNPAFTALTGYTAQEAVGQNPRILKSGKQDEAFYRNLWQTISSGQVWSGELTNRRKDGSLYSEEMTITPLRNADGVIARYIAIEQDITVRKQAEAALRSSEERFRIAAETANDVIYEWDLKQGLEWLGKIDDLLGYEPGEFPRTLNGWAASVHPEDLERTTAAIQAHLEGRGPYAIEYRVRRKDGVYRWWSARGAVARTPDGKPTRWIGSITDITDRKQAETVLRESQQIIEGILNAISVRVFWKDKNLVYLGCNAVFARDAGFADPKDIIGKDDYQMAWRDRAELYRADDRQVIESGGSKLLIEEPLTSPGGNTVTILTSKIPLLSSKGEISGVLGTFMDITDRKRAELALVRLAAIIESSDDAIIGKDLNSIITSWNKGAEKLFGYTASEMVGTAIMRLLPADRQDEENQILEKIKRGESVEHIETRRQTKDGRLIDVSVTASPIKDATGKVIGASTVARDITERKRLEAQLFQSQKLETVGKLAGGVAHEFNSILTAIIGQSELLLGDLPAGSPLAENATEISKAAGRAATLTRQLLAYGRKQILQPEILDLNSVLAGMESTLRHLMGADVDVCLVPAVGLHAVKADAGQIEQVIMNMATNARDAMPNGGKLTLETANVTLDQESVSRFPELKAGEYVMLAITDTGTGMSEEAKARVFEPFFSTKGVGQGTGLGLSTCYGIIKQSGGHISVYSELTRGANFKIYLPQVEQQAKIPIQRLDSPDLPRGTETILLVEDDPALREMAATLLRRLGYTVLAAANGIEALSLKQQRDIGHIDLLFTDVVMPHMSGKELADRVRALYPHTRILFTSAYTENVIVHQGILNPGVALLQKPFTPGALALKVREVLDQPSAPKPDTAEKTLGFMEIPCGVNTP